MYDFVELYNKNGTKALVQRKNIEAWKKNGWTEDKPGDEAVAAYEQRSKAFASKKTE